MSTRAKRRHKNSPPDCFVEVVDAKGKPFLVMPQRQALRQNLKRRSIVVCLRNLAGKIFLHKSQPVEGQGATWGLAASGAVLAGESRLEAAERLLQAELGIVRLDMEEHGFMPPTPGSGNVETILFVTAKTSAIPHSPDGMFVDREELKAILRDFPHMAAPYLHHTATYLPFS